MNYYLKFKRWKMVQVTTMSNKGRKGDQDFSFFFLLLPVFLPPHCSCRLRYVVIILQPGYDMLQLSHFYIKKRASHSEVCSRKYLEQALFENGVHWRALFFFFWNKNPFFFFFFYFIVDFAKIENSSMIYSVIAWFRTICRECLTFAIRSFLTPFFFFF